MRVLCSPQGLMEGRHPGQGVRDILASGLKAGVTTTAVNLFNGAADAPVMTATLISLPSLLLHKTHIGTSDHSASHSRTLMPMS